ncbi:MAG TPA: uroporphyrinogen-III C-methyltransferase [Chlorobaculum parvum]|uniref:uroporphyrinogen-III C-methyltransferase n=1 Tax=Chlorobaculum parvum TaxID=274539 RepID=A0A7C5DD75_9CHLB|nr:uroporphyrinogen-III C-methyltransferase [Chlorobaculum parvum]
MEHSGKVWLVGAGPGDPELLTVRAHKLMQAADVVLHDALISSEILALLSPSAERISVGKRIGDGKDQTERQLRINDLLARYAHEGKCVVRLKAGDPFMFGRGIEEVRALAEVGVPCEVVPAITAGIAAADLCRIPLTERHRSSSALFCTGHTADYSLSHFAAVIELMKAGAPLVMYMGFEQLDKIVERFIDSGLPPELPACAVSRVSRSDQAVVAATLGTIVRQIRERELPLPVVFIIGEHAVPEGVGEPDQSDQSDRIDRIDLAELE